jgi:Fur family ferric uptake transcriptional regulator
LLPRSRLRMTRQRQVILEELRKMKSHPTADELYETIRKRIPHISLGTVYRNLDLLARDGFIRKLELGGTQKRFDGDTTAHYHMRCVNCGRVDDAHVGTISAIEEAAKEMTDYEIIEHRLEFIGLCPHCAGKISNSQHGDPKQKKGEM